MSMPVFRTARRGDGSCLITLHRMTHVGPVLEAVAHCPPGCHPTDCQVIDCQRAMMGQPVHVDETC